jgi:hypothetical protein
MGVLRNVGSPGTLNTKKGENGNEGGNKSRSSSPVSYDVYKKVKANLSLCCN